MVNSKVMFIGLCTVVVVASAATGRLPTKEDLISLYEKSLGLPDRASFTAESNINVIEGMEERPNIFRHFTFCRDGMRRATNGFERITLKSGQVAEVTNTTRILDKRSVLVTSRNNQPVLVYVDSEKERKKGENACIGSLGAGAITYGLQPGDDNTLPNLLRANSILKVRDNTEEVDGHLTYVLEAQGKYGKIMLWLDPNAGYNPRRVTVYKSGEDLLYGKPLSSVRSNKPEVAGKQLKDYSVVVDSVKIEDINGVFIMTAGNMTVTQIYTDGYRITSACDFRFSNINLNPDFNALKAFEINVPDGTPVTDVDFPGGSFEVRQGKIVSAGTSFEQIDKAIEGLK